MPVSIKRRNQKNDEPIAVKIICTLKKHKSPLSLSEISKEVGLPRSHVLYHLRNMKKRFLIIEAEKNYICQPYLQDISTVKDLTSLLSVIISVISREIAVPEYIDEEELGEAVHASLDMLVHLYKYGSFE